MPIEIDKSPMPQTEHDSFWSVAVATFLRTHLLNARRSKKGTVTPQAAEGPMADIQARRAELEGQIDRAARNGIVCDAYVEGLHATHVAELVELKRQFIDRDETYRSNLRRLEAMYPAPPPPVPEPPAPRAPQHFPRLGNLFGERSDASRLH